MAFGSGRRYRIDDNSGICVSTSIARLAQAVNVNRTESAVRITAHISTGIVTSERPFALQKQRQSHEADGEAFMNWRCRKNAEKQAMEDTKSDIGWEAEFVLCLDDSRTLEHCVLVETRNTQVLDVVWINLSKQAEESRGYERESACV